MTTKMTHNKTDFERQADWLNKSKRYKQKYMEAAQQLYGLSIEVKDDSSKKENGLCQRENTDALRVSRATIDSDLAKKIRHTRRALSEWGETDSIRSLKIKPYGHE